MLVSAGTGSRKTESFLCPIISRCSALRQAGARSRSTRIPGLPLAVRVAIDVDPVGLL